MTTVMVVDDHPMWREAVERDLTGRGFDVLATASDAASVVRRALAVRPDVVVMDLQLGAGSGVDATRDVVAALPATRVLVLSASAQQADVLEAVKAGASGYLVKSASADELADAVTRTAAGDAVFSPGWPGCCSGSTDGCSPARRTPPPGSPSERPRC